MTQPSDQDLWSGIDRRLAGVERLIPTTPRWRPEGDPLTSASPRLVAGRAFGRPSATPRRTARRLAWVAVLLALAIALIAAAIIVGVGRQAPTIVITPPQADQGFFRIAPMTIGRVEHSATLLKDGRVLIVGGQSDVPAALQGTSEVYDPSTRTFSQTGSMSPILDEPSATLLGDGRVLVTGYLDATAELYDPATGTFRATGSMSTRRWTHSATLLTDGMVLMAGGKDGDPVGRNLATAELYDPKTGTFSPTGSMAKPRMLPTATLLKDGRVLIVGGDGGDTSAELYDPRTGRFSPTGNLKIPRQSHTATLLADGRVLILGGWDYTAAEPVARTSAELYDPATGTFQLTGSMAVARTDAGATLLPDGRVLVTGGGNTGSGTSIATRSEVYDPRTGTFSLIGTSTTIPYLATTTLLTDGDVLIAGGEADNPAPVLATAFLFDYRLAAVR